MEDLWVIRVFLVCYGYEGGGVIMRSMQQTFFSRTLQYFRTFFISYVKKTLRREILFFFLC